MIKALKGFMLKNDGPWGSSDDDSSRNQGQRSKKPSNQGDFDEVIRGAQKFLESLFGGSGNKGGNPFQKKPKVPNTKSVAGIVILSLVALWLASGFYKVNSDENAVILYFGKFHTISTPGLNYRIPAPFSKVIKRSVTKVNTEEFGASFQQSYSNYNNADSDSLMLTGDENIVDIDFQIQWQISDVRDFVFNIADTRTAIQKSAESAMREIIAKTPIADALSDGKQRIEQEAKILLQEILDSYSAGVRIVLVQLLRVDPPKQVIDSFRDVQTAKADKEREINQAQAYKNDIIPRARGEAAKMIQEAEAYKESVISDAIGQTERFLEVYREYARAKTVTKRRIYLETMEKIYEDMDKIIIDKNLSKSGIVPYLPLNEIKKNSK